MATLREASLDRQGIPRHKVGYYLRDARGRTMSLSGVRFVNGRSTKPVSGWLLRHLVATMGPSLKLEPVDAKPKPAPVAAPPKEEPPQEETEPDVDLDLLTKAELEQLAFKNGIEFSAKATKAEIRELIREASQD